jgi:SOS-response transcriptional repressor LexA
MKTVTAIRIKEARNKAGFSARELSELIGVKEASIWHWEGGRYFPKRENLSAIARATGFSCAYLRGEIDNLDYLNKEVHETRADYGVQDPPVTRKNKFKSSDHLLATRDDIKDLLKEFFQVEVGKVEVPIMGSIKAGPGGYVYNNYQGTIAVEKDKSDCVAMKIWGQSLEELKILEGDLAIIRPGPWQEGDLVAVFLDDECCTIKKIFKVKGEWRLGVNKKELLEERPSKIFGKVIEVRRTSF